MDFQSKLCKLCLQLLAIQRAFRLKMKKFSPHNNFKITLLEREMTDRFEVFDLHDINTIIDTNRNDEIIYLSELISSVNRTI